MIKFCISTPTPQREKLGGFLVANFLSYFPKENRLKFVTSQTSENFTTFSTARKEIYHLELALGATSRNICCFRSHFGASFTAWRGMQHFCLQLEASCFRLLAVELFACSCVWELIFLQLDLFFLQLELLCLQLKFFCLQWENFRLISNLATASKEAQL